MLNNVYDHDGTLQVRQAAPYSHNRFPTKRLAATLTPCPYLSHLLFAQLERVQGYVHLLHNHALELWLLEPSVGGLAAVRSEVMRLTAGTRIIMMDDDAQRFKLSMNKPDGG